jgi:hypothetical protein
MSVQERFKALTHQILVTKPEIFHDNPITLADPGFTRPSGPAAAGSLPTRRRSAYDGAPPSPLGAALLVTFQRVFQHLQRNFAQAL